MADLQEYAVDINGLRHTMMLDEADAQRWGAKAVKPANKAVTPRDKGGTDDSSATRSK